MKARSKVLLDNAISAMIGAVELYNKPSFSYRTETYSILAINAWELLFKAKWLVENKNKESSLFIKEHTKDKHGKRTLKQVYKRSRSGAPLTKGLSTLGTALVEKKILEKAVWDNISLLIEIRDAATHFYNQSPKMKIELQAISMASTVNFSQLVKDWFKRELADFKIYLMPLAFLDVPSKVKGVSLSSEESSFIKFADSIKADHDKVDSKFSVAVNIDLKFTRVKSPEAIPMVPAHPDTPNATKVIFTDEQFKDKYPLDHGAVVKKCKTKYCDFVQNQRFHEIMKEIKHNPKYAHQRFIDPANKKSTDRFFYSQAIFTELSKHYAEDEF